MSMSDNHIIQRLSMLEQKNPSFQYGYHNEGELKYLDIAMRKTNKSNLPIECIINYLLYAFRITDTNGQNFTKMIKIILDSPSISQNLEKYFCGKISFERIIKYYELLFNKGLVHPLSFYCLQMICGWNLHLLVPRSEDGIIINELKIKNWIDSLVSNNIQYLEICLSIGRVTSTKIFKDNLKRFGFNQDTNQDEKDQTYKLDFIQQLNQLMLKLTELLHNSAKCVPESDALNLLSNLAEVMDLDRKILSS